MRIEQLEYVVAVINDGSLRRASQRLHVSLPALSEGISKLERELGVALLERHRTGARISASGSDLLSPIVEVIESVGRLRSAAEGRPASRRMPRIGTVGAGTASVVLPAVRAFQAQHVGAAVEIRTLAHDQIEALLVDGTLEVGIVTLLEGDDPRPELVVTTLRAGRPVAVLPAAHLLARRPAVTADDLRRERFVAMRAGDPAHRVAQRLFGADLPHEWHSADGAEMGAMMVAEGLGVAVLPDFSVAGDPLVSAGRLVTRPLADPLHAVAMVALHRRRPPVGSAVADLIAHLRAHAEQRLARRVSAA